MLATLCNILTSCDIDIPKGTLPPIVWHNPANFVGALCCYRRSHCLRSRTTCRLLDIWMTSTVEAVPLRAGETLQDAANEAQSKFRVPASIILVCLPTTGAELYREVKRASDGVLG